MSRPVQSANMATKDIRPSTAITICDVCGRTLLRGEHAEVYIDGGARRSVCELCKPRALHEGWLREGTVPTYDGGEAPTARRGSLLGRLRRRRERERVSESLPPEAPIDEPEAEPQPPPPRAPRRRPREPTREPRHVRAVPMGAEHKMRRRSRCSTTPSTVGRCRGWRGRSASRPSRYTQMRGIRAWLTSWPPGSCAGIATRWTCPTSSRWSASRPRATSWTSSARASASQRLLRRPRCPRAPLDRPRLDKRSMVVPAAPV